MTIEKIPRGRAASEAQPSMANVLALDQASKVSGYAIFQNDKFVTCGVIKASSSWPLGKRLVYIADRINELINQYQIEEVVCEDVILEEEDRQTQFGYKTFKALCETLGIVVEVAYRAGKPITILSANDWRRKLGIRVGRGYKRTAVKAADIEFVKQKYNITPTEDECDAICIGTAYLKKEDVGFDWSK